MFYQKVQPVSLTVIILVHLRYGLSQKVGMLTLARLMFQQIFCTGYGPEIF